MEPNSPQPCEPRPSPRPSPVPAALLVAAVAFLVYLPTLGAQFLEGDDARFVRDNPDIHALDAEMAVRYFTDPSTLGLWAWEGTYRPLRTLDFAIDWAISGGRPWLFHLHNILWHVFGSLLVLALFRKLGAGTGRGALYGALLFAAHPVQAEVVAWITSRGDALLLVTFLGALLLHISGRRVLAGVALALALLSKEAAVVFPAVALLVDHHRGAPLRLRWYAVYAALAGAYVILWILIQPPGIGHEGDFGHNAAWWGGSYGANLLTMSRALVYYVGLVIFPVRQVLDYFVTMTSGLDLGAGLGILILVLAGVGVWRGGKSIRFAVLWFAITISTVTNILFTVGTPATERFLYLPMVGLCLMGGRIFARPRFVRFAWIPLACLILLTFSRSRDWVDMETLMASSRDAAVTQLGETDLAKRELDAANEARDAGDRVGMTRHAEASIRAADRLIADFAARVGIAPRGPIYRVKWAALFLLERDEEALATAREALSHHDDPYSHRNAALACIRLGRVEEAADSFEAAIRAGHDEKDLRPTATGILNLLGEDRMRRGLPREAMGYYKRSWALWPDPVGNRKARDALRSFPGNR